MEEPATLRRPLLDKATQRKGPISIDINGSSVVEDKKKILSKFPKTPGFESTRVLTMDCCTNIIFPIKRQSAASNMISFSERQYSYLCMRSMRSSTDQSQKAVLYLYSILCNSST